MKIEHFKLFYFPLLVSISSARGRPAWPGDTTLVTHDRQHEKANNRHCRHCSRSTTGSTVGEIRRERGGKNELKLFLFDKRGISSGSAYLAGATIPPWACRNTLASITQRGRGQLLNSDCIM
ncbi:hypothetical protein B0T13DRAFT_313492 [Neurospora crassa]|nr:hypothetical protein B0T13DRAFT_313492 [Neurospora crassa]